ncbi:hypothetical protein FDECE_1787 [Fusarium decemcellulare]|nr:hypothetical protein FDECE_1787 [Fusarium decemcellulare]
MASTPILLITGANAGLGFQTVTAAVREISAEFPQTANTIRALQLNIEDDDSISKVFYLIFKDYGRLDVLINNAEHVGAQFDPQYFAGQMTQRELWNKSWDVNTTGTHILTDTLVPLLLKSADPRVLFITSGTATLAEHYDAIIRVNESPPKGWPKKVPSVSAYRSCKTGGNMMMREWARILKEDGVKVWGISPGFLATGLGGDLERNKELGAVDPSIGANFVRDVVEGARDQDTGKVIRSNGVQPW